MEEATSECMTKWNNKPMFFSPFLSLKKKKIKKSLEQKKSINII